MQSMTLLRSRPVFFSLLAAVLMLAGCSSNHTPLAFSLEDPAPSPQTPLGLVPSFVEQTIGPNGGQISFFHHDTHVQFQVPRGALTEPIQISLRVQRSGRSTQIQFKPNGLHFLKPAQLKLSFPEGEADFDNFGSWVIRNAYQTESVPTQISFLEKEIRVVAQIPHFTDGDLPDDGAGDG